MSNKLGLIALEAVRASNAKLNSLPDGLVAVFVGATSGIGASTVKQFCRRTVKPRVYIVGRSEEAASRIISELQGTQPEGQYNFIKKDITLLKNVDEVCNEIKSKESKLNLLFMTPGTLSMKGRNETTEGLDKKLAANYYARLRFTHQLLPVLESASPQISRVVSVLSPGEESSSIYLDDLDLKTHFSLKNAMSHAITMTDFAFEELAKQYPTVSFVHAFPGGVKTGFAKESGALTKAGVSLVMTVAAPWMVGIEESGERHLYASTSARYRSKNGQEGSVDIGGDSPCKGSAGELGSGAYLIGWRGEFRANETALQKLREKGAGPIIWDHTVNMFSSIRG